MSTMTADTFSTVTANVLADGIVVRLAGSLDVASLPDLRATLLSSRPEGCDDVLIDAGRVTEIHERALAVLVAGSRMGASDGWPPSLRRDVVRLARHRRLLRRHRLAASSAWSGGTGSRGSTPQGLVGHPPAGPAPPRYPASTTHPLHRSAATHCRSGSTPLTHTARPVPLLPPPGQGPPPRPGGGWHVWGPSPGGIGQRSSGGAHRRVAFDHRPP